MEGEGEEKKEVMVAMRVGEEGGERVEAVGVSSEKVDGVEWVIWPKRRPLMSPGEEEKRCKREDRVGPEICIRCSGRSSMAIRQSWGR